jgi:2-oxoglutarate/2-oxoacid ferredoxin oxidoreductase subunit beta
MTSSILGYFRQDTLPHIWCPGCGHGTATGALVRAIQRLGLDKNKICVVSGIGCSSRAVGYLDFDTVHTAHGRALAFATGIKLARPEMKVIVMTGDGDCAAIGGNHFIHAARRNIEITTIVMNNSIYGMTSGQYSPMTPKGMYGTTAPYGNLERSFDLCELAKAAGATYVGRSTSYHVPLLIDLIEAALRNKGFSVVEALVQCPTYLGRKNKIGGAVQMLERFRDGTVNVKAAAHLPPEKLEGKILIGELRNESAPEYSAEYKAMASKVRRSYEGFQGGLYGCASNSD